MHDNQVKSQVCLFYLHHPTMPPYIFCAESEKDLEEWINALLDEISRELLIELPADIVRKATVRVKNGTVKLKDNFMDIKNEIEAKEKGSYIITSPIKTSISSNTTQNTENINNDNEISEGDYEDDEERTCATCGKAIETGNAVFHISQLYHSECFTCYTCKKRLNKACINVDDHPYCRACAAKILHERKGTKNLGQVINESTLQKANVRNVL